MTGLNELRDECHQIAVDHGFWEKLHDGAVYIALMHSELSEALEALRKTDFDNLQEELADCIIRILDYCGAQGIDIEQAVSEKCKKNVLREYKHGKEF